MTVSEVYQKGVAFLRDHAVEDAPFECRVLAQELFSLPRGELPSFCEKEAELSDQIRFFSCLRRRVEGEPLQYLIGSWDFYDLRFFVGRGVLIPRPETEKLVDMALPFLKNRKGAVVYDLCAGTGCIGLTIARHCPQSYVFLFEKSEQALPYLNRNLLALGLTNARVIRYDIEEGFAGLSGVPAADLLLSNPPYIPSGELPFLQKEVQREPAMALDGGADGLRFYRSIADLWLPFLHDGAFAAVETAEEQPPAVAQIFSSVLSTTSIYADAYGVDRFVCGWKGEV